MGEKKLRSNSASKRAYCILVYVIVTFLAILAIIPFWYMFSNATFASNEIQTKIRLMPNFKHMGTVLENWSNLKNRGSFNFFRGFGNSFFISTTSTVLSVYFAALTAYGLKCYTFKGNKLIYGFIVGVMMVPTAVSVTGFYQLMVKFNMISTPWPMIIPAMATPATVFFIKQYLDSSFSIDIVEAARIDGASEFFTFNVICLPIMIPAIATQGIFTFLASWNNFFIPSLILEKTSSKTLPLLVAALSSDRFVDYGMIYTGLSVSILPVVIVYIFLQRFIVQGIAAGGVKE